MTTTRRILGIDPGSRVTGFGVVDFVAGEASYVGSGVIRTDSGDFSARLRRIYEGVGAVLAEYRPQVVSVETVFMARNAGSALKLGQARAAALCATFEHDVRIEEFAPREIKQAVTGTGGASKQQVQHMIVRLLELEAAPAADAADALAAAVCSGHQRRVRSRLTALASIR